nr:Chain P, Fragment of prodomain [Bacillus amyloliquefaciens]
VEEDHVAHA